MASLSDARFDALRSLGFTGATNDMLLAYFQDGGATAKSLNDAKMQWLAIHHPFGPDKQVTDLWFDFLRTSGFNGALNDMELAYWLAQLVP